MTVEALLRRGWECKAAGDLEGAEAAYREADELDHAEGAILLGLVLQRRGDFSSAADAFRRAEARGHPEAGSCLGNLLSDETGDMQGAQAAYERSIAAGSSDAVLNLGLMLAEQGAVDEALPHLRAAEENGEAGASWAIGKLLRGRGDFRGAATAYRHGADGGNADAAYGLGVVLTELDDPEGARAAFQRAHDLGHDNASKALEVMDMAAAADASAETAAKWAQLYAAACGEVLTATHACLDVTNQAIGARNMTAKRPQAPASIRNFTTLAEAAEGKFGPLYSTFEAACTAARDTAAQLLAAAPEPTAELVLAETLEEDVLNNVATVNGLLAAKYGPSPAAFLQGIEEANALIQDPAGDGNIYRPAAVVQSGERTCPWCAETIKAAAVICRFCGRDVDVQPNAG
jgi:tetratricopeptide (TPR) repeat protein